MKAIKVKQMAMRMIAEQFNTFLFDLDGVVYIGNRALPGASISLERLRAMGKTLRFLTNDPRSTREEIAERLFRLGIETSVKEIVTCGWATAAFLKEKEIRKVYVVGSEGLCHEIEKAGVRLVGGNNAEAVVVGCDESVGYPHICHAAQLIRRGAFFIATNADPTFPTLEGLAPATGAIVAAVKTAAGKEPRIIGKPYPDMFKMSLVGLDRNQAVMIGDSLGTDILGARQFGITGILVAHDGYQQTFKHRIEPPEVVISSLTELFKVERERT